MTLKDKQKSKRIGNWIPTEIIIEILLKLPVESLLRCKSVSKEWYSLICDQGFIKAHYTLSSTNINSEHHRLIYNTSQQKSNLKACPVSNVMFDKSTNNVLLLENPLQRTRPPGALSIVGSCNGLLCILVKDDNTLFLYNPSTRRTNFFPGSKQGAGSYFSYGFGYDETTHDYKVVKLWRREGTWPYLGTMIYSLKAGSWKEIGCFPGVLNPFNYEVNSFFDGKFLNGALHWAPLVGDIVSLDLGKETYGKVLHPEYTEGSKRLSLGVLGACLRGFCYYYERQVVDVWVMKVYGVKDSWTKLVSISHPNNRIFIPFSMNFQVPLCISNDGKLLFQFATELVVYDCIKGSYSEIQNLNVCPKACIVVESLVSPFAPLPCGDN